MNRTELILKIVYWSAITLAAILKARSARRLARCLLPAFLCAHIERDVWVRGRYGQVTVNLITTKQNKPTSVSFLVFVGCHEITRRFDARPETVHS